jgi:hypothetical protein
MKPKKLDELCVKLQELQRARSVCMKSRIMLANRLQAIVAGTLGYYSGMAEKERASTMKKATQFIADVVGGDVESNLADMIRVHQDGIDTLTRQEKAYEKSMIAITKQLPIMDWVEHQNQRGFGPMFLAIVIGETGNLSNYANPAKLWKRLGCAPFTKDNTTQMGATWRTIKGGLNKEDWTEFGYSPRRRSISYLIGENIVKSNKAKYRARYDEVKKKVIRERPDWTMCKKCSGKGINPKGHKCADCKGTGKVLMHAHRHAMLLDKIAAKKPLDRMERIKLLGGRRE